MYFFLNGGYQYDCFCIIEVDEDEVKRVVKEVYVVGKMVSILDVILIILK